MTPSRGILLVLALGAVSAMGACSQGESIPVLPLQSTLDGEPDPFFVVLSPACGDRVQRDVVMLPDGRAWIFGTEGLILRLDDEGEWRAEAAPRREDIGCASASARGRVIAVGTDGFLIERADGSWRQVATGTGETLREIGFRGEEAWVVGDRGIVLRGDGATWEQVACPVDSNLSGVCAHGEDIYVCGDGGLLLRYSGSQWRDAGGGPWNGADLLSVVSLGEGTLVVCTRDSVFQLLDGGWDTAPVSGIYTRGLSRLEAHGDEIWFETDDALWRLDASQESWTGLGLFAPIYRVRAATDGNGTFLMAGLYGDIRWLDESGNRGDPAGRFEAECLFEFVDGTCGVLGDVGLLVVVETGLEPMRGLSDEVRFEAGRSDWVGGISCDHFYLQGRGNLHLVRGGEIAATLDVDLRTGAERSVADGAGGMYFCTVDSVYRWDGERVEAVQGDIDAFDTWMRRTGSGRILAWSYPTLHELRGTGVLATYEDPESAFFYVGETEDGDLFALNRGIYADVSDWLVIYREGAGSIGEVQIDLVPGVRSLWATGMYEGGAGIFLATTTPASIFRLESGMTAGRWERVAGPYPGRFVDFRVRDDGSVLAWDAAQDHILLHSGRARSGRGAGES